MTEQTLNEQWFGGIQAEDVESPFRTEFLTAGIEPDPDAVDVEPSPIDPNIISEKKRSRNAISYEKKVNSLVNLGFRTLVAREATVPDAAALVLHGPTIAEKAGDLADANHAVASFIDHLTDGTENPTFAFVLAVAPFAFQVIRNHEPVLEPKARGWKIPFSKTKKNPEGRRINLKKFGVRLGLLRNYTNDPDALSAYVLQDAALKLKMDKLGIQVAAKTSNRR